MLDILARLNGRGNHVLVHSVGLMLGQRRRRWPNIKPTLIHILTPPTSTVKLQTAPND